MRRIVVIGSGVGAGKLAARVKRLLPGCEVNMILPEAGAEGSGPFSACLAGRRASRVLLAAREVGVLDASELSVDLDASTVITGSSRGRLAVRYDQLAMEIDATPRIPRALRGAPNVFAWPCADATGLDGLLAERVAAGACRAVVVGQGAEALEALRLVRAAGATPVWVRTRAAAGDAANAVDADMWRHAARMARRNGAETVNWTGVAMERMGALPAESGGFAALVAVGPDRAEGGGGSDLRVEGDLFIWTAPMVVQNPALTLDGISLDDTGRIDVDGCLRTGAPGVYVFGTGVGVERMAPDGSVERTAAVPAEVPGLVRALADHLASIDGSGASVASARGVSACPASGLAAELARSDAAAIEGVSAEQAAELAADLAAALGDCPCRLPALGTVHGEGPGVTVSAVGLGAAACARAEVETEFSVYATPAVEGGPARDDDDAAAWGGLPAGHAVKLLAAKSGGALLGAQVVGRDAELCAAVVSAASLALRAGMRVADLAQAELPGGAGELLRRAAAVLSNKLAGRYFGITSDEFIASREAGAEFFTLDLRSAPDWRAGHLPDAYNIPHTQLRKRLQDEVPRFTPIVLVAATSDAAWSVACMLGGLGATDLYVLDGGMAFWPHALETA